MASPSEQIKKINKEIQELSKKLGKTIKVFNVDNLEEATLTLRGLKAEIRDIESDIGSIASAFKNVVDEISKTSKGLSSAKKTFNALGGLAQKLKNDQDGIAKLNKKDLQSINQKVREERANLVTTREVLRNKEATVGLSKEEENALGEINGILQGADGLYRNLLITAKERLDQEEKISDAMGLGGAAVGGIKKALDKLGMGGLVDQLGLDEAKDKMREVAERVTDGGKNAATFGDKFAVLKAGASSLGKSILKNLTDPLVIAGKLVDMIVKSVKSVDASVGKIAKGFNLSYNEALKVKKEISKQANDSENVFVTTDAIKETQLEINKALGTSVMLSGKNAIALTEMREMAGFTNEELQGINAISLATGQSVNDITGEFMAQAKLSAMQNGVLLNEKELLKDIGNVSAATTLSFSKNPKLIAQAVATAKSLGMELGKVDDIAGSLLNFEESIQNELQAELLLNKDINLERARQAALNNDLATVAKEISDQIGTSAEFSEMNRIQQEALAKSVGMSREDLAETLFVQEQLKGLTSEEAKDQEALLQSRIEAVGLAQAQKELAEKGVDGLREQASNAERFSAIMAKLQDTFVQLVTPIMQVVSPIVDLLVPAIEGISFIITPILEAFNGISEIIMAIVDPTKDLGETLAKMGPVTAFIASALAAAGTAVAVQLVPGLIRAGIAAAAQLPALLSGAIAAVTTASASTLGIGALAIAAGIAGVVAAMSSAQSQAKSSLADDMAMIPSGYGDTIIKRGQDEIALNNNDALIAGTNLFGGQQQDNSELISAVDGLGKIFQNNLKTVSLFEVQ